MLLFNFYNQYYYISVMPLHPGTGRQIAKEGYLLNSENSLVWGTLRQHPQVVQNQLRNLIGHRLTYLFNRWFANNLYEQWTMGSSSSLQGAYIECHSRIDITPQRWKLTIRQD